MGVNKLLRLVLLAMIAVLVLAIGAGLYARLQLRNSLPQLDGTASVPGLLANVRIERDALGIPAIHGGAREDVARALGFLHAQDRFFQMDLQRRQPAGELSALVGPRALDADAAIRVHRFRDVAHRAFEKTEQGYRRILEAYAEGVNAGVAALAARPFEYAVLRATPERWLPEDSILTVLAMFNTLQGRQAQFEQTLGTMHDALPEPMYRFLATTGSEWDTPVLGEPTSRPLTPTAEQSTLRQLSTTLTPSRPQSLTPSPDADEAATIGSNNWAVAGSHTASGAALVANDMHLSIGVPIIWYRASFSYPDPRQAGATLRITGVTLPGLPGIVVGSNGHVAWGFTNTGGDWSDLVRLDPDPRDRSRYLTPEGPKPFDVRSDTIAAKGGVARTIETRWTIWGPIVWTDARGREYAQRWVAHDANLLASDTTMPERARTVDDLLEAVAGLGMPNQNVTMADRSGRVAWTIGGAIPRRVGHDGSTPQSWADGTHRWDGYLSASEFPRIVDPGHGRIWTANAPVVDGAMLATIGEGGYADGIRARLIRDRLMQIDQATPKDMLDVQLEDRALFLERWREVLMKTIVDTGGPRAEFRSLIDRTWTGRASPDSVAYRLVRTFRANFVRQVMTWLTEPARAIDPAFDYSRSLRGEGPVWQLIEEQPAHLLDPRFRNWDEAILAAVDASIAELTANGGALAQRSWGEANRAQIVHPLASAIPFFGRYLNMPGDPLPGDVFTPRASSPRTGPSERMVVSPGREEEGILHVPTGQSGHPLSPHYGDQYRAWLDGEPTPFLPGPAVNTLTLTPRP